MESRPPGRMFYRHRRETDSCDLSRNVDFSFFP